MPPDRTEEVWAGWADLGGEKLMGHLHASHARGKEIFSFQYEGARLAAGHQFPLDPALRFYGGRHFVPEGRVNFGVLDSSPDRWGRVLMQRREAQLARELGREPRRLFSLDYLVGVHDGHRMGGFRYRFDGGPLLDDNAELASPPWTSLRELEQASLHLEREGVEADPQYAHWLRLLIAPGRSLGGARPKASVVDEHGRLWIAKFPGEKDDHDVGGWESVVHTLASRAGVLVADATARQFGSRHHTFLTQRFDRTTGGGRYHFASAMTMLERGDSDDEVASYLELVEAIIRNGARPARDLEQLWRRIVFFVCVSNVDDHLRNHGFLLEPTGWVLAPAYDMNPVAFGDGLALNISETDNAQDLELVRDVAPHFRLTPRRSEQVIQEVLTAVREWPIVASQLGLARTAQDEMAAAFRVAGQVRA